jgi:hypothetical protein
MKKDSVLRICKVAAVLACTSVALAKAHATTTALNMSSVYYLGDVVPALPEGDSEEADYINTMIGLAINTSTTVTEPGHTDAVNRSGNSFSGLTTTTAASLFSPDPQAKGTGSFGTGYQYLFAFYGSGNNLPGVSGQQVALIWDISGLSGNFTIPTKGLSHDELFQGGSTPPTRVPDGASTAELLGGALVVAGLLRKKILSH